MMAHIHDQIVQANIAANASYRTVPLLEPSESLPVLLSRAIITPYDRSCEGELIKAVTLPLRQIIAAIQRSPSLMYEIDPRKWEEIVAATYHESGLFDEVTLTPRSGDRGRDVIAVRKGFGGVRLIESVKRKTPGHKTTAEEVWALLGVLLSDPQASKGIVSTTWEFAPKVEDDPDITKYIPNRLELLNGPASLKRFEQYTSPRIR
jgi:restriction system protein